MIPPLTRILCPTCHVLRFVANSRTICLDCAMKGNGKPNVKPESFAERMARLRKCKSDVA